jgi:pimeloyl-ACP methyl ester carboxylesterase
MKMSAIKYKRVDVDGFAVAYREAGPVSGPALLLLHGFPTSSHMFRNLIPKLVDRYRVVAPDLPGFGQSDLPSREKFKYTFSNLAKVMARFTEVLKLYRYRSRDLFWICDVERQQHDVRERGELVLFVRAAHGRQHGPPS